MTQGSIYRILIGLLCLLCISTGHAQENWRHGEYDVRSFSSSENKGQPQNWAVVQDRRGVIYIANNGGLLEYDGNEWQIIDMPNEREVLSLDVDDKGRVWLGAYDEFGYLSPDSVGTMTFQSLRHLVPDSIENVQKIWKVHVSSQGVWFQSKDYLFLYQDEQIKLYQPGFVDGERTSYHTTYLINDVLWVKERRRGIMRQEGDEFQMVGDSAYLAPELIYFIVPFKRNGVLLATKDGSVYRIDHNDQLLPFEGPLADYLQTHGIYHGTRHEDNVYSFSTRRGGCVLADDDGEIITAFDQTNGLTENNIKYSYFDDQDNLWMASINGVMRVDFRSPVTRYDALRNLEGTVESAVFHDGTIYAATSSGVYALDRETQQFVNVGLSGATYHLHRYAQNGDTALVAVTTFEVFEVKLGQEPKLITGTGAWSTFSTPSLPGMLFVAAENGLMIVPRRDGRWGEAVKLPGIEDELHNIVSDRKNGLWIGAISDAVYHVQISGADTIVKQYGEAEGLPQRFMYCKFWRDELLVGTDQGIYRLKSDGSGFEPHPDITGNTTAKEGAFHRLSVDKEERLWAVWEDKNEKMHLGYIKSGSPSLIPYERPFVKISKSVVHSMIHEEGGITWLGGPDGLYRYDANVKKDYEIPYPVYLRTVAVQGRDTIFGGVFTDENGVVSIDQTPQQIPSLSYSQNGIKFFFSSGFYQHEEETQYRWFLEGNDEHWSEWDDATEANYTNLNEGTYYFHLEARNFLGHVSRETVYTFTVLPPWYRTWWAYTLYVIGFVIFVYMVVTVATRSLREMVRKATAEIRRQKDEIEEQKQLVDEKNKDITDSIEYASTIQTAILPAPDYLKEILPESFVLFNPRDIVSGDFYWVHRLPDGKIVATAADCTGHGVPGAFMSMIGNSLLNEIIIEQGISRAEEILNLLKDGIIRALNPEGKVEQSKDGMDLALIVWDPVTRTVDFAGANNPLYVLRKQSTPLQRITGETFEPNVQEQGYDLFEIKGDKQPIGYLSERHNQPFTSNKLKAEPGDTIYLFSDGYADQFGGPKGKKFKYKPFKRLLCTIQEKPMSEQLESLSTVFENWRGEMEQVDDVCVIGIRL